MTTKPAKGAAKAERAKRRAAIVRAERDAKRAAFVRDHGRCRRCGVQSIAVEGAHLVDKGMGGDHGLHSSEARHFVTLCANCHRGPYSVHSGHVMMVASIAGGDGEVLFTDRDI